MRPPVPALLAAALAALLLSPGCSCSGGPAPEKIVKRTPPRPAKSLPSPLQVFLDERKSLQSARHDGEVAKLIEARTIDPKTLEKVGGDVEMHEFLKQGVALFGEKRYEEALAEFERVAAQYPNDKGVLVVAQKNMSITCLKLGRNDEYLTHVQKYAELLSAYLDENDAAEIRESEGE